MFKKTADLAEGGTPYSVGTKRNKTPWITPGQDKLCCQMSQDKFVTNCVTVATKKGDYQSWDVSFLYFFCKTETYSFAILTILSQYFCNTCNSLTKFESLTDITFHCQFTWDVSSLLASFAKNWDKVWVTDRYYLPPSGCQFTKKFVKSFPEGNKNFHSNNQPIRETPSPKKQFWPWLKFF